MSPHRKSNLSNQLIVINLWDTVVIRAFMLYDFIARNYLVAIIDLTIWTTLDFDSFTIFNLFFKYISWKYLL